jgi:hypothetical protein
LLLRDGTSLGVVIVVILGVFARLHPLGHALRQQRGYLGTEFFASSVAGGIFAAAGFGYAQSGSRGL